MYIIEDLLTVHLRLQINVLSLNNYSTLNTYSTVFSVHILPTKHADNLNKTINLRCNHDVRNTFLSCVRPIEWENEH